MLIDCFLWNGEIDCLRVRCEELKGMNVLHVLVEADRTFTGKPKELQFPKIKEEFSKYNIRYIPVNDVYVLGDAWETETLHRNAIQIGLHDAQPHDVVIISDVDEIPNSKEILKYKKEWGLVALQMDNFWYKFNMLTEKQSWTAARIMPYSYLKETTPDAVRRSGYSSILMDSGWHWSYLGDENFIQNKLASFSHQEYNCPPYNEKEHIIKKVKEGKSLWGNGEFTVVPIDETFPLYIRKNQESLKRLIA